MATLILRFRNSENPSDPFQRPSKTPDPITWQKRKKTHGSHYCAPYETGPRGSLLCLPWRNERDGEPHLLQIWLWTQHPHRLYRSLGQTQDLLWSKDYLPCKKLWLMWVFSYVELIGVQMHLKSWKRRRNSIGSKRHKKSGSKQKRSLKMRGALSVTAVKGR